MNSNFQFRRRYEPPAQENKKELQAQLDQQVRQFLENGGKIQKIPTGLSVGHSRISRDSRQVRVNYNGESGDADG